MLRDTLTGLQGHGKSARGRVSLSKHSAKGMTNYKSSLSSRLRAQQTCNLSMRKTMTKMRRRWGFESFFSNVKTGLYHTRPRSARILTKRGRSTWTSSANKQAYQMNSKSKSKLCSAKYLKTLSTKYHSKLARYLASSKLLKKHSEEFSPSWIWNRLSRQSCWCRLQSQVESSTAWQASSESSFTWSIAPHVLALSQCLPMLSKFQRPKHFMTSSSSWNKSYLPNPCWA